MHDYRRCPTSRACIRYKSYRQGPMQPPLDFHTAQPKTLTPNPFPSWYMGCLYDATNHCSILPRMLISVGPGSGTNRVLCQDNNRKALGLSSTDVHITRGQCIYRTMSLLYRYGRPSGAGKGQAVALSQNRNTP